MGRPRAPAHAEQARHATASPYRRAAQGAGGREQLAEAQEVVGALCAPQENLNAWVKVCPLIVLLCQDQRLARPATGDARRVVGAPSTRSCARGSWLHASPDGMLPPVAPSPLAGLRARAHVRAEHVTPTFVGKRGQSARLQARDGVRRRRAAHGLPADPGAAAGRERRRARRGRLRPQLLLPGLPALGGAGHPDVQQQGALVQGHLVRQRGGRRGGLWNARRQARRVQAAPRPRGATTSTSSSRSACAWRRRGPTSSASRGDRAACDFCKERKRELDAEGLLTQQQVAADAIFTAAVLGEQDA